MTVLIPENVRDLLNRAIPLSLATLMPDDQPQVTPVWFKFDGEYLIINTARGRQKDRNLQRDAKVTGLLIDPDNMYHWAELRGYVAEITEEGAYDVINEMAHRYWADGRDYPKKPDEVRVTYKIALTKINGG
jgi:PPOX class probable F420-dependent enzyme